MPDDVLELRTTSAATDGGFIAIADVATALEVVGLVDGYRLLGGIAVMLHVLRTGVDVPLRVTGDADYGVPPQLLQEGALAAGIEQLGYRKTAGDRWEGASTRSGPRPSISSFPPSPPVRARRRRSATS